MKLIVLLTLSTFILSSFAFNDCNGGDCITYDLSTQPKCIQVGTESDPIQPVGSAPGWALGLNTELDTINLGGKIIAYKIQWFNGAWTDWYIPGKNDIDWKANGDSTLRRVWSYFTDHCHLYIICTY